MVGGRRGHARTGVVLGDDRRVLAQPGEQLGDQCVQGPSALDQDALVEDLLE